MANKRIKDLSTTASVLAADDYVAIDGNANGTRKIVKGDLVNDISTQVAGTYLDEANNLSDVASKDTSKLNLEVPDVGTAPNEVPLNGQLGTMAYQSADSVAMASAEIETLEVTDKVTGNLTVNPGSLTITGDTSDAYTAGTLKLTAGNLGTNSIQLGDVSNDDIGKIEYKNSDNSLRFTTNATEAVTIDSSQRVGIGGSPGSYDGNADDLVVETGGHTGITVRSSSASNGAIYFAKGTSGDERYRGYVVYNNANNQLQFGSAAATQWVINSSGDFVSQGGGIDFSATGDGSGTMSSELLDDYEEGTWTPQYYSSGGTLTATMDIRSARYVKVGHMVTVMCYIRTSNVDNSSASGSLRISGLPYAVAGSNNYTAAYVGHAIGWTTAPAGGYTENGQPNIIVNKRASIGGNLSAMSPSDLTNGSGTNNEMMLTASYCSF